MAQLNRCSYSLNSFPELISQAATHAYYSERCMHGLQIYFEESTLYTTITMLRAWI